MRYGPIAVKTNEAEVHDTASAKENVDGGVNVTPPLTKDPVAHHFVCKWEWHNDKSEEAVGNGQRADEPILDTLQGALRENGNDDQRVSTHDHNHDDGDKDGGDEQAERRVAARIDDACPPRLSCSVEAERAVKENGRRPVVSQSSVNSSTILLQ